MPFRFFYIRFFIIAVVSEGNFLFRKRLDKLAAEFFRRKEAAII